MERSGIRESWVSLRYTQATEIVKTRPVDSRAGNFTPSKRKGARVSPDPFIYCITTELLDQLHVRDFLEIPLLGVSVVFRVHEHLPVLVVHEVVVRAVVVARVTGFLAELDVLHVRLGGEDAVVVLPRAQQLVRSEER